MVSPKKRRLGTKAVPKSGSKKPPKASLNVRDMLTMVNNKPKKPLASSPSKIKPIHNVSPKKKTNFKSTPQKCAKSPSFKNILASPLHVLKPSPMVLRVKQSSPIIIRGSPFKTPQKDAETASDDSPMPSPFRSSKKKLTFDSPTKKSPRKTPRKRIPKDYHNALDKILSELQDRKEKDEKLKEMEKILNFPKFTVSENHTKLESSTFEGDYDDNNLIPRDVNLPKDRTQDTPPGLKILEPARCFRYFSSVEDIIGLSDCFDEDGSPHFEKLSRLPPDFLTELIERGGLMQRSFGSNPTPSILLFLFRLMAVHASKSVVDSCKKTIEYYMTTCSQDFRWCPSLGDVVGLTLNYGSGIRDHCPLREEFVEKEKEISVLWSPRKRAKRYQQIEPNLHICKCRRKHAKVVNYHNFRSVVEMLGLCINGWNNYCSKHLSQLILLLCWLSLDNVLMKQHAGLSIQKCIISALSAIEETDWPSELLYLSEELAGLGGHHHNTMHIIRLLLPTTRGIQLQQSTAFSAMQTLLDEEPTVLALVTPKDVLKLLKRKPLQQTDDYYLLYSIVSMLDIAVGNNISSHKVIVDAICTTLMRLFSKINDSIMHLERTQLKNLIVTIRSKWIIMMQDLPTGEKVTKLKVKTEKTAKQSIIEIF